MLYSKFQNLHNRTEADTWLGLAMTLMSVLAWKLKFWNLIYLNKGECTEERAGQTVKWRKILAGAPLNRLSKGIVGELGGNHENSNSSYQKVIWDCEHSYNHRIFQLGLIIWYFHYHKADNSILIMRAGAKLRMLLQIMYVVAFFSRLR